MMVPNRVRIDGSVSQALGGVAAIQRIENQTEGYQLVACRKAVYLLVVQWQVAQPLEVHQQASQLAEHQLEASRQVQLE
jgi:hypothetical protein